MKNSPWLTYFSDFVPLLMTVVSVAIVLAEWIILGKLKWIRQHKEGITNLYSGLLTYAPIFFVNTFITISLMFVFYDYRIYTFSLSWYTWILAYIAYDFMSFIIHLASHKIRLFWCIHSVHHSPKEMKASVSFRGSFAEFLLAPHLILWLPILGFHPLQIVIIEGLGQLYGVPLHLNENLFKRSNRIINKVLVTPRFHHLHHAKNDIYLDTNYGLTFAIWDRLFNTYQESVDELPEYGLTKEIDPSNLIMSQTDEFKCLFNDIRQSKKWSDKLKYIFYPPGWSPTEKGQLASDIRRAALLERMP